jgi:hypothetical protein
MATYATIPKDEAEPLVSAAPKAASPKFKAAALAKCDTTPGTRFTCVAP